VATFPSDFIVDPETLKEICRVLAPGGRLIVVPSAWITGKSIPHRLSAWLFHITNESPPGERLAMTWISTLERRLSDSGFIPNLTILQTSNSSLLLVVAKKNY
jgi:ubiquinone/menaquinone biosynthesis C-methylase UbiE